MLRLLVRVIGTIAFGAVLIAGWVAGHVLVVPTIATGVLLVGVWFEHYRYRPVLDRAPGAGWQATDERFVDPDTGRTVTVFYNAATGERRYVAAGEGPGSA